METKTKNSDNKDHNLETEYAAWWSRSLSWGKRHPREVGDREDKEGWLVTTNGVTWDAKSKEYLDISEYPLEYLCLHINTTGPSPSSAQPLSSLGLPPPMFLCQAQQAGLTLSEKESPLVHPTQPVRPDSSIIFSSFDIFCTKTDLLVRGERAVGNPIGVQI